MDIASRRSGATAMSTLSIQELASATGAPPGELEELTALGLLERVDGRYPGTAVARVRLLLGFRAIGVSMEAVAEGARRGAFRLGFVDELMLEPTSLAEASYDELIDDLGIERRLGDAIREVLGTIDADPSLPVREDDQAIIALVREARALGADVEQLGRIVRINAWAVRAVVRAQRDFVDEVLIAPAIASGLSASEALTATSAVRRRYREIGGTLTVLLLGRFVDEAVFQSLVELGERALEREGLVPPDLQSEPAIAFADITAYTSIAETLGDEEAARVAQVFGALVDRTSAADGGRLVKLLGDGAMVAFGDVADAVRWAPTFVGAAAGRDIPPVHVGIDAGRFVRRDGDYFGSVVNVASRLADQAGPGEILVTGRVADRVAGGEDLRFEALGARTLRNVASPVAVFRLRA